MQRKYKRDFVFPLRSLRPLRRKKRLTTLRMTLFLRHASAQEFGD